MSRNKDIELLHLVTQEPYSVCRARMKRNHWIISEALLEDTAFGKVAKATREMVEAFTKQMQPVVESVIEACKSLERLKANLEEIDFSAQIMKTSD